MKIARLLDASFNRAREGMRVIEDLIRFVLDEEDLYIQAKNARLQLGRLSSQLEESIGLIANRDTETDVGTNITLDLELERRSLNQMMAANFKRVQEALRVLEEVLKLIDLDGSQNCKKLRYQNYLLEYRVFQTIKKEGANHDATNSFESGKTKD